MGGIGQRFAEMAHNAFGMPVFYHSRRKKDTAPSWAEFIPDLETFLGKVDVVSVHIALKAETVGFMGEKQLRAMKKGSILINTARGKVVDEEALIKVLEEGHVSRQNFHFPIQFNSTRNTGLPPPVLSMVLLTIDVAYHNSLQLYAAGLDVYPNEPEINPRLFDFPNLTLLPHMGTETEESQHTMEVRALTNLRDFLVKGSGRDIVPEYQQHSTKL